VNPDVTELLRAHGAGQTDVLGRLVPIVYDDLRKVARAQLARYRRNDSLNTTALIHDAYLRLVDQTHATYRDRGHFFAVCAIAMRQIIVDYARRRGRQKRGGHHVHVDLDDVHAPFVYDAEHVLAINGALERLAEHNLRLARVVECRFFAGLNEQETAEALDISVRTAQREWLKARAWLRRALTSEP
jgi:RNA polymerase sigma factor (TIGR02999 family)